VTLLLNRELVSRAKLCMVSVFPDIVKDCPKIRNLPKIFLTSFENVAPEPRRKITVVYCGYFARRGRIPDDVQALSQFLRATAYML